MKEILILDCDPGIDDAFALFYAMADKNIDLRLITTVSGNVSIDKTTKNAQRIVAMAGKQIEIAQGSSVPLVVDPVFADDIHGGNGMGDYKFPKNEVLAPLSNRSALQAQYEVIMAAEQKVVVAAVGPLTNIALLLNVYPEVKEKIKYFAIMGGGIKGGNTTSAAEFNFYVDPEAAQCVFKSGVPIRMSGLDVTDKAVIRKEHIEQLRAFGPIGTFLSDVSKGVNGDKALHDVVAIMSIHEIALFTTLEAYVQIETSYGICRGYSLADVRPKSSDKVNTTVLVGLDHEQFLKKLFEHIESYKN